MQQVRDFINTYEKHQIGFDLMMLGMTNIRSGCWRPTSNKGMRRMNLQQLGLELRKYLAGMIKRHDTDVCRSFF